MHKASFSFTEEYNKLNPAQKQAVETTEGPVLVIAGPGTGKTQILAARVGNILDKGLAHAENVLCLTYTEAGVTAMRKRLIKFIGTEAYKVNIHTFHSFCNKVIQDNPSVFGFGDMEAISELEEITLLHKLIDNLDSDSILKRWRGKIYYDTYSFKALFSLMKRENITIEKITKAIDYYLAEIYPKEAGVTAGKKITGKDGVVYEMGEIRMDKVEEKRKTFDKTIAAAKLFNNYQELKKNVNRYDYDDMIHDVLQAFQNNEILLSQYQEQFHYFLVDEYQDTNGSQNEILRLLYSYWENPNIFVVGDDDQSIYRFQGASLENILSFYQNTLASLSVADQKERIVVLKNNYRSTQQILDVAAESIKNNTERLVNQINAVSIDKTLTASGKIAEDKTTKPLIVKYPNPSHEIADITNQIGELYKKGIALNKIAVLYKEHKMAEELQHCLNQKEIPFSMSRSVNILNEPLSRMLLNIFTYVNGESKIPHSREDLLFEMLHYPFFEIQPIQAARLSFELRESRYTNPKTTWREALLNMQKIFDEESYKEMKRLAELSNKWQKNMQQQPLQLFFQTVIDDINCIKYIQNNQNKIWLLQELKTLFDFVKQENAKNGQLSVDDFLSIIEQMKEYNIALPIVQTTYAKEAVQLTTIHGSKGLEYEYVFLMSCTSKNWETKRKITQGFVLPYGLLSTVNEQIEIEDLRRLFFVALTRTEKRIQMSYTNQDWNGKEQTPSLFITEIAENPNVDVEEQQLSDEEIFEYTILQMQKEIVYPELLEHNLLKSRLENYTLSVTHLNNYLECPLKFYYNNFIQVPSAKNEHMAFGSAVHDTVEAIFNYYKTHKKYPSEEEIKDFSMRFMYKQQDSFTKKQYDQKLAYLQDFMPKYVNYYASSWNTDVLLEEPIEAIFKEIPLRGFIDKIEKSKSNVAIIDYKTGDVTTKGKEIFEKPLTDIELAKREEKGWKITHEHLYGGNYWRQAIFYKILLDNSNKTYQRDWNLERVDFDFLEPNKDTGEFEKRKIVIDIAAVLEVKKQIEESWNKIQNLEFEGCQKEDCLYCNREFEQIANEID